MANLVINPNTRIMHDEHSEERCNVDALRRRGKAVTVPDHEYAHYRRRGYRLCHWCELRRVRAMPTRLMDVLD